MVSFRVFSPSQTAGQAPPTTLNIGVVVPPLFGDQRYTINEEVMEEALRYTCPNFESPIEVNITFLQLFLGSNAPDTVANAYKWTLEEHNKEDFDAIIVFSPRTEQVDISQCKIRAQSKHTWSSIRSDLSKNCIFIGPTLKNGVGSATGLAGPRDKSGFRPVGRTGLGIFVCPAGVDNNGKAQKRPLGKSHSS
ncbi:hypothetical protein EIP91_004196 [Steccherinum ochraceum]|uniref:Uncharacterized protein n=1 Tax=Steccherinum ochraceum TaxID=92696 RepID=A0A4R0RFG9_9APHY|nr:hypothetical protein EIP91_004196 [Steccherinum ochraceum]